MDELVELEQGHTVKLANLVAEVQGGRVSFEVWTLDEVPVEESVDEYVARVLEGEKASRYIPSEAKFPAGRTLWIVYYHEGKKRRYAKRVYAPGYATDFVLEGPGGFEIRFGKKVWGRPARLPFPHRPHHRPHSRPRGAPSRALGDPEQGDPAPAGGGEIELRFEHPPEAYDVA